MTDTTTALRRIFAAEGVTETPTRTGWGDHSWAIECRSILTRRQILDSLPDTQRERKAQEAQAYSIDLDEHDTIEVQATPYRSDLRAIPPLGEWIDDLARKIPEGYEPVRVVERLGKRQPRFSDMTPAEFAGYRHLIGLTFPELADMLRVNERTLRRWETGASRISAGAARDIEALAELHADETRDLTEIPDGPRPRGWYVAGIARQLERNRCARQSPLLA